MRWNPTLLRTLTVLCGLTLAIAVFAAPAEAAKRRRHPSASATRAARAKKAAPVEDGDGEDAAAAPARPSVLTLTSVRSWSAPSNTRVVFDFSGRVTLVTPDSGSAPQLVITVPHPGLAIGADVARMIAVRDSAVDSVLTLVDSNGAHLALFMRPGADFKVFTLDAGENATFRVVVDVERAGAQAAEDKRLASIATAKKRDRVRLVVIDAGHGGEDTGAHGPGGVYEKNVTLAVASDLADALNKLNGVRAVLTRDSDFFIPLHQRYKIAEKARADLFISIHCNSSKRRGSGSGTEVYFLSLKGASDQADKDLADIENAADLVGGVSAQAQDDVVGVLYDVKRNSALERSQFLAETLVDHIAADRRVESRGIKQAGFAVLKSVEFPSVLVETAFINNPREVKLLTSPEFQRAMGQQLTSGIVAYFGRLGITIGAPADSAKVAPKTDGTSGSR
jgi:N-acetylmuramoyl-L-alanine amidase